MTQSESTLELEYIDLDPSVWHLWCLMEDLTSPLGYILLGGLEIYSFMFNSIGSAGDECVPVRQYAAHEALDTALSDVIKALILYTISIFLRSGFGKSLLSGNSWK